MIPNVEVNKNTKKEIFFKLLKEGFNQKQAAQKVGVTEKTACIWVKKMKKSSDLFLESVDNIALRLKDITSKKDFSIADVKDLTQALKDLEDSKFVGYLKL